MQFPLQWKQPYMNNWNIHKLVHMGTHYPVMKKQWVEFLGERPTAATDRVETSDTAAA